MTTNLYSELPDELESLETPAKVLTIGAHPDDAEFGAGALLSRWADAGAEITMLVVTDGSKGSWDAGTDKRVLALKRIEEQSRAADVLGASCVIHLDHVDGELEYTMELRRTLAMYIRTTLPDVLLTHDPWQRYQLHPDHRATGLAAVDAVVAAREPLMYPDSGLRAHRPGALLLWSADEPNHAEPVTEEYLDRKLEALLCHSSQGGTTMGSPDSSDVEMSQFTDRIEQWHRRNGEALSSVPAEVFRRITP